MGQRREQLWYGKRDQETRDTGAAPHDRSRAWAVRHDQVVLGDSLLSLNSMGSPQSSEWGLRGVDRHSCWGAFPLMSNR